jgi:hypothetical protein
MTGITMRIRGHNLPGLWCSGARTDGNPDPYGPVHVGIQRQKDVINLIRGDVEQAVFEFPVDIRVSDDATPQFHGPFVQRRLPQQFVYLSWGELKQPGTFHMFRCAKVHLTAIDPGIVKRAVDEGGVLEGAVGLTDGRGHPRCASVRPPVIIWSVFSS